MNLNKKNVLIIFILTTAAILFRFFLMFEFTPPCCGSDERTFHAIAQNIVEKRSYEITKESDPALWTDVVYAAKPPLYPYFIAITYLIFGENYKFVWLVQIFLSALTSLLLYKIGERLHSKSTGILTLFIYSFFWETAYLPLTLRSENLQIFLTALLIYVLTEKKLRTTSYVLTGIVIGLLTLNRGSPIIFIIPISLWLLWKNINFKSLKSVATIIIFTFLTITPWTLRNYQVYHQFVFIYTDGGINIWMGNHVNSGGSYNPPDINDPNQTPILKTTGVKQEIERDNFYYQKAKEYIKKYPIEAIDTDVRKIYREFFLNRGAVENTTLNRGNWIFARRKSLAIDDELQLFVNYQFPLFVLSFLFGLLFLLKTKKINWKATSIILFIFIINLATIAMSLWEFRYLVSSYPLMIPFSALSFEKFSKAIK